MLRNISSWSILHPVPTLVLFLLLTVAGLAGYDALRINRMPDVDLPAVSITAAQPGAAPSELETQVTRIVEDTVAGLDSVRHVYSTVNDGVSVTMVEFELGTDIDRATNDVRNLMTRARASLPAGIEEPSIQRLDMSGGELVTFVVRAPSLSPEEISWFVDNDVSKAMLSIGGVSQVQRQGGVTREISVRLDPHRLAALGITVGSVSSQLGRININLPGGRTTIGSGEQSIRTLGSAATVRDLADTEINLSDGRKVRLSELGEVSDAWAEQRSRALYNGEEVVGFGIVRSKGSSEVSVANAVRAEVAKLDAARSDIEIHEVTSTVKFAVESFNASAEALIIGAILAVLVVWWFLRDMRATFVSAIAIPLSLIPTFAVMALLGHSFNIVSLLALSLTIGVLVDDAIVEIENIVRHMREGKPAYQASLEAADEIGLAVVATSATIIAVFAPVGFMPGIIGQFFKTFAVAACVSVFFSLVVARMLTPLCAAYLLRFDPKRLHDEPRWIEPYIRLLTWSMKRPKSVIAGGVAFLVFSLGMMFALPSDFVPSDDQGRSVLGVELPPGATIEQSSQAVGRVLELLKGRPEVESTFASIGSATNLSGPGQAGSVQGEVRRSTVTFNLVGRGDRDLTQQEFESEVSEFLRQIPGVRLQFGADGQSGSKIQVTLVGDDPETLMDVTRRTVREMRTIPSLSNVVSKANLARPELLITPKPDKAAALGVAADNIAQAARVATIGDLDLNLPKFNLGDRQIPIRLMLQESARADLSVIANLRVPANNGRSVPLSSVADIEFGAGPSEITRTDRRRRATIEAEMVGVTLGEANEAISALPVMRDLPPGVHRMSSGDVEQMAELGSAFGQAIVFGVLLTYVVLTILFGSFAHPLTILTALPLSLGGAFGALLLAGKSLSIAALIGILMLMGIAAKNSILLVEYAIVAMEERGIGRVDALILAARKRARPIIMTTVAMTAGMVPVALAIGANAEFRSPMGLAVIGGLITSTLLSLIFVPSAFLLIDNARIWTLRRFGKLLAAEKELDPAVVTSLSKAQKDALTGES